MASLNPGVLVKLLEDMNSDEKPVSERRSPMLQVRSIVPVMEEGNLWPNRGFYLKVSDMSHAMYVSLPHDCDEMILNNQLQLGQYIYVQKLESATPVPVLRGIKVAPGKHPCVGSPEDLVFTKDLIGSCGMSWSDTDSRSEKSVVVKNPVERPRSVSASRAHQNAQGKLRSARLRSIPRSPRDGLASRTSDIVTDLSDISISCSDRDSDSDSSSFSWRVKPKAMRRSWNGSKASIKEWQSSPIVKRETKPLVRSRSAGFPPYSTRRYDTCDDSSSCKSSIKRTTRQDSNAVRSSYKQRVCALKDKQEIPKPVTPCVSPSDRKWTETTVSWDSLPPNLVKLGKEVLQQRDAALVAAVEALQEACATERLIQCLRTYSDLQSSKDNDPQSKVDKLLDLHDNVIQSRFITQSLATISPVRTDTNPNSPGAVKEAVKLTLDRKNCAVSWIKAAMASDLSYSADPLKSITDSDETTETTKKLIPPTRFNKLNGACTVRKLRKNGELQFGLATVKEHPSDWVKGSSLHASIDLDCALQGECRKCFLTLVEEFLDGIMNKTISTESDSELAGVMCQIKRVDDWLDVIMSKEGHSPKDGSEEEESMSDDDEDIETCQRLKSKLYMVLLKHVERSAIALESMSSAS